ncbi:hypothetical protein LEQ41_05805 [Streptococcus agalactiae]|nr:hypothetical protein [Streptococcus agalactiae]
MVILNMKLVNLVNIQPKLKIKYSIQSSIKIIQFVLLKKHRQNVMMSLFLVHLILHY